MTSLLFGSRPWVSEEQTVFVKVYNGSLCTFAYRCTLAWCYLPERKREQSSRQRQWAFFLCWIFNLVFQGVYHICLLQFTSKCNVVSLTGLFLCTYVCEKVCVCVSVSWTLSGVTEGCLSLTHANSSRHFNELSPPLSLLIGALPWCSLLHTLVQRGLSAELMGAWLWFHVTLGYKQWCKLWT